MKTKIDNLLATASPTQIQKAQKLLDSDNVLNVTFIDDAGINTFEAMIAYSGGILMPYFMTGDDNALVCQCERKDTLCVHKIAVLLAAQIMLETDCSNYRMAMKIKTAQAMERILYLFSRS